MRKFFGILFCFFATSVVAATPTKMINIQHWKTQSGANVYFVAVPNLPMLDIRVVFAAGSAYDGKTPGLATMTNSLIGEGTKSQTANQITEAFDNNGAQFNTSADRDKAIVALRTLSKPAYLNPSLREFTDVLTKLSFKPSVLQRIKNQTIAAIKVEKQRPGDVAENAFYKTIYGNQPYAHNPLGTSSSVKSIFAPQIQRFYRQHYVARNADIILVGDLTKPQAQKVAKSIAGAMPAGRKSQRLTQSKSSNHDIHRHIQFPTKQTAIMIGQIGINRKNPDYFPLVVGNYVFGGLPLGSVLFQKVRNQKGLAYYAGSAFLPWQYRGPFVIQLKTRVDKTKEALNVVQDALSDFVKDGPTAAQLKAAKQNLIGGFRLRLANNSNIASVVTAIAFYHRPLDYLDKYIAHVRSVTPEQVKSAFNKTIKLQQLAVITVGPRFSK